MYDIEQLLLDVETLLKANMNTYIGNMNTEKADSITLVEVDNSAYFYQSMNSEQVNMYPYVFFGVTDIEDEDSGPYLTSTTASIDVIIVLPDEGDDVNLSRRMFRYGRILKDIFTEKFDGLNNSIKLSVKSQVPVDLIELNTSRIERAIGVKLTAEFA